MLTADWLLVPAWLRGSWRRARMRLFAARETHIRTSFAHNVYNQNMQSDIRNIYHLELIRLFQRPWSACGQRRQQLRTHDIVDLLSKLSGWRFNSFQLALIWSSFWHFAPHSLLLLLLSAKFSRCWVFFYTFFFFFIAKIFTRSRFFLSFCFYSFPLTSWHCHLHLRFTHARNNKIYLFSFSCSLSNFSQVVSFFLLFSPRLTTVTNELWLVLLHALTLVLSFTCLCKRFSCSTLSFSPGKYSNFFSTACDDDDEHNDYLHLLTVLTSLGFP